MRAPRPVGGATPMALGRGAAPGSPSPTNGAGEAGSGPATRPTDFPASPGAASSTTAPATDPVVSSAAATAPPSAFPSVAPPKECANTSDCKLVKSYKLGSGVLVAVFSAPSASGGIGAAVL